MWGPELAAKGMLHELQARGCRLQDRRVLAGRDEVGDLERQDLRRADQQRDHGADLERAAVPGGRASIRRQPPATWDDVVAYSRQIKEKTGKRRLRPGRPRQCRQHALSLHAAAWAYGGGALDEAEAHPTYKKIMINNAGTKAALQACYDMYVRDKSVPTFGADQHADREPGSVHRRPARHDDQPSERIRGHARPRASGRPARTRRSPTRWSRTCATG